jgi:hypothetical protein
MEESYDITIVTNQEKLPGTITALVIGIISVCFFWLGFLFVLPGLAPLTFGIIALIKAAKARKTFAANPERYIKTNKTIALIGVILGIVGSALTFFYMILGLIAFLVWA